MSGFAGWSAGIGVGVNSYNMNSNVTTSTRDIRISFSVRCPRDTLDNNGRSTVTKFGPMGNLFLGYGYVNDIYYVGANLGLNFVGAAMLNTNQTNAFNINITDANDVTAVYYYYTTTTQTKVSRSWVEPFLDLKLGGLITPETLAYAIAGLSLDNVTTRSISVYTTTATIPGSDAATANTVLNYSKTRNLLGLRLGAGAEAMLTSHIGVGAQYVYSFFPSFNDSGAINSQAAVCDTENGCATTPAVIRNNTQTVLSDQQVLVQFIYHV